MAGRSCESFGFRRPEREQADPDDSRRPERRLSVRNANPEFRMGDHAGEHLFLPGRQGERPAGNAFRQDNRMGGRTASQGRCGILVRLGEDSSGGWTRPRSSQGDHVLYRPDPDVGPGAISPRRGRVALMRERIILVPGVGLAGAELLPLAARLRGKGYRVSISHQWTGMRPLDDSARALWKFASRQTEETIHFIGHSLGGLVTLRMLENHSWNRPGRVVTLGTPHAGLRAARRAARIP